jgi:hypothetical protein
MQLRNARLCLDCDEVHEESHCPVCASESFAFIKRWVPASERRTRQRQPEVVDGSHRETISTYKELLAANDEPRLTAWQLVRGGAVSLALLGAAGWMWRRNVQQPADRAETTTNGDSAAKH